MAITVNQPRGTVVFRSSGGNTAFISTSANAPTSSRANTVGETISAMYISEIMWTIKDSAVHWAISRGANTILQLHGTDHWDLKSTGMRLEVGGDAQSNCSVQLSGGSDGDIIIKLHKVSGEI